MRRKRWVLVPELKRKIDLALELGLVSDWKDLGRKLAQPGIAAPISPKTIRWWILGSAGHEPGDMPQGAFYALSALFASTLRLDQDTARDLLAGSAAELEDELSDHSPREYLLGFLHGAVTGEARLVTFDEAGLVEVDRKHKPDELPEVQLHAPFRLEFKPMHRLRSAIALQHAGRRWGSVEASRGRDGNAVHVPGLDDDGLPFVMREHEQGGIHSFYCIQSARPLPPGLKVALAEPVELDRRILTLIARHYEGLGTSDRRCQLLRLHIK